MVDEFFATDPGEIMVSEIGLDERADRKFLQPHSAVLTPSENRIRCINAYVVMRKTKSAPFRCALEVASAHSELDKGVALRYQKVEYGQIDRNQKTILEQVDRLQRECIRLQIENEGRIRERDEALSQLRESDSEVQQIYESRSWRLTAPIRALGSALRGKRAVPH